MNEPLVSVLCITYGHEAYIAKTIEAILKQRVDFSFELIIGEDCSPDGTLAIVNRYAKEYPDIIKVVTSEMNVGARENGRRIYRESRGKYVAFCEGDDYWSDRRKLQTQVDYMEANPDCSYTFHSAGYIDGNGRPVGRKQRPYKTSRKCPIGDVISQGGGFSPSASIVMRKSMFDNDVDFFIKANVGDYPRQLILASKGHVYYIDKEMSKYRYMHAGSWTSQQAGVNQRINNALHMMAILDGFDEYTDRRFHKAVDETRKFHEFNLALANDELKALRSDRLIDQWKAKSMGFRFKTWLRCLLPKSYKRGKGIYKTVSGRGDAGE